MNVKQRLLAFQTGKYKANRFKLKKMCYFSYAKSPSKSW